ncbi:MAG: hypothetical protein ABL871_06715 [Terricaulis sp.]
MHAAKAVKTFCLNGTKLHLCESIDRCTKRRSHLALFKNCKRERQQDQTRMTLKPQKAPTNKAEAASEESEHQTSQTTQQVQSEVEERSKKNVRAKKSAQKQHDARPEVANTPLGLNEKQCPTEGSGREDAVGRRKSDEFALRISDAALLHMAHREAGYLSMVKEAAYELIYESERMLCGHIVQIGHVPAVNLARWWRAFDADGLWFVLKPCDPPRFSKVREYELLPATGPTPEDDVPPTVTRGQKTPAPDYIGPPRRRNRGDANGARAAVTPKPARQARNKKRNEVKRIFTELYNSKRQQLNLLSQNIARSFVQSWRAEKPRLLRSLVEIRRLSRSCGIALHYFRDELASVVQASRISRVFSVLVREASTRQRRQLVSETFGPSGRLEPSAAGHVVSPRLRLNSWTWDEPPVPWAEDLFGVIWTPHLFGVREEEQVFT